MTINAEGLVTRVERGNLASQSTDWATFAAAEAVETGWDSHARPLTQRLTAGGATYALTQTGYDSLGRVECVARRMNPAAFASPPAGACALGPPGSAPNDYGPDRIVRTFYDAAGRVAEVKVALGTPDEATEVATHNACWRFRQTDHCQTRFTLSPCPQASPQLVRALFNRLTASLAVASRFGSHKVRHQGAWPAQHRSRKGANHACCETYLWLRLV